MSAKEIPRFKLEKFRPVHRSEDSTSNFGNNQPDPARAIPGFELFSSEGILPSMGPVKSEFYRLSLTVSGSLNMQIGLDHYIHQPRTVCFTYPGQILSKNSPSKDALGYYILFSEDFLGEWIPSLKMADEFPFYDPDKCPIFQLSPPELEAIVSLILRMDRELQQKNPDRVKALQLYLHLILMEARRSYERQELGRTGVADTTALLPRFKRLVSQHYISRRQVADYAALLSVTPGHLNRTVKETTGRTASDLIRELLLREAKALLRYTPQTVAEIAYGLDFSDPGTFNRFFKRYAGVTPQTYRNA